MKVEFPNGKIGTEVHRTLKVFRLQILSFLSAKILWVLSIDQISTPRGDTSRLTSLLSRVASTSTGRGSKHRYNFLSFQKTWTNPCNF